MSEDRAYRFNQYQLLPHQRRLLDDGRPVKLGSRAFDLLVVLVERRDRNVAKHELFELVWPQLVVEENNLQVQVLALRKLLGHPAISTIPGRGYRFTLPVTTEGGDAHPAVLTTAGNERCGRAPLPASPLLGRDDELQSLRELVAGHRLVTVAGAGGIGKTRLAQGLAHSLANAEGDGVWWVELAGLSDAALLPAAVGQALGLPLDGQVDVAAAVARALHGKSALLVLDNAEHLLDGVAAFVGALRQQAADIRLLVTSQEVLRLMDEQVFRPGPLSLPVSDDLAAAHASGAVALFVARACMADPRFELSVTNRAAIVDICRRLDGIPLAIELAAARVPLLGVEGLRARLDERFQVLTAGARAVMRRHQTLRAALEWSHSLLTPNEQRVFRRLGVFTSGFTLEAAQDVVEGEELDRWEVLDQLGGLVDKSLVMADGDPLPRYRLLETARLYALERLAEAGETDVTLRCHAQFCLDLAEAFEAITRTHGRTALMLDRLDQERDNLLHALAWCDRDDDPAAAATGQRLAGSLTHYWGARGWVSVGLRLTQRALDRAATLPADRHRCKALGGASQMLHWTRQAQAAAAVDRELLMLGEALGHAPAIVIANVQLGSLAAHRREWDAASTHFETALALARRSANLNAECHALGVLGDMLVCQGRLEEAAARREELLQLCRRAGHSNNIAAALEMAGRLALLRGDAARTAALLAEAQPLLREAGSRMLTRGWCTLVGGLAARHQRWAVTVQLLASATRFRADDGVQPDEIEMTSERAELDGARAALSDDAYNQAWAAGLTLSVDEALDLAVLELALLP